MIKPDAVQSNNGFIRIIVILIILLLVFTFAGFNLQDSFSVDSLINATSQLWEQAKLFYFGQLQIPLHNYVVDPMRALYDLLTRHIINEVVIFVKDIMDKVPVWQK